MHFLVVKLFLQKSPRPIYGSRGFFSLYTALDVKRDKHTLRQLILSFFPELSEKNQEALLLKISTMYIGFSLDTKEFSLVVEGNFPALVKSQLNKKNGWEKKRYSPESVGLAQNFFLHTDGIALAFVHKNFYLFQITR